MLPDRVPSEGSSGLADGCLLTVLTHGRERERELSDIFSSKDTNPIGPGLHIKLNYFSTLNTATQGVRTLTCKFGWGCNSVPGKAAISLNQGRLTQDKRLAGALVWGPGHSGAARLLPMEGRCGFPSCRPLPLSVLACSQAGRASWQPSCCHPPPSSAFPLISFAVPLELAAPTSGPGQQVVGLPSLAYALGGFCIWKVCVSVFHVCIYVKDKTCTSSEVHIPLERGF